MAVLDLRGLICDKTQEDIDELYIVVFVDGGEHRSGRWRWGPVSMTDGDARSINWSRIFHESIRIELWGRYQHKDYHIGDLVLEATDELGSEQSYVIASQRAGYRLIYSVNPQRDEQILLDLVSLHCNDAQEPLDEPYLVVNGSRVWGPSRMRTGQTRKIVGEEPIYFSGGGNAIVELRERDPRRSQRIGDALQLDETLARIYAENPNEHHRHVFHSDRGISAPATYTLTYRVSLVGSSAQSEPIQVNTHKQLFIDDRFIACSKGIELTMNPPAKTPRVDVAEIREENTYVDFGSVFFDPPKAPDDQCSYKCVWLEGDGLHIGYTDDEGHDYCDSTSTWDEFGVQNPVFPYYPDGENTVMYDPRIDRYVAYFRQWIPRPGSDDTCEEADPRKWFRTVGRLEIEDPLKPWCPPPDEACHIKVGANYPPVPGPEFETVLACDEDDPPDCDFYRHGIMRYPWADTVYLAFPTLYRHFPEDPEEEWKNDGLCDVQLATSRDGIHWRRFRGSYIRLGLTGSGDEAIIYSGRQLMRDGDLLRQYYEGYSKSHATPAKVEVEDDEGEKKLVANPDNPLFAAMVTQRLDGFVSADASYAGSELTTPLLEFTGNRLELNIDTSAGGDARVELLDSDNRPISGFTLIDANLIQGNFIRKVVTWKNDEGNDVDDLSALQSKPVRIRFVMRAAKLYAFQFTTPSDTRDEIKSGTFVRNVS